MDVTQFGDSFDRVPLTLSLKVFPIYHWAVKMCEVYCIGSQK